MWIFTVALCFQGVLFSLRWPDASLDSTRLMVTCLVLSDISEFQTLPGGSRYSPWKWPWAKANHSWHRRANLSRRSGTLIHNGFFFLAFESMRLNILGRVRSRFSAYVMPDSQSKFGFAVSPFMCYFSLQTPLSAVSSHHHSNSIILHVNSNVASLHKRCCIQYWAKDLSNSSFLYILQGKWEIAAMIY